MTPFDYYWILTIPASRKLILCCPLLARCPRGVLLALVKDIQVLQEVIQDMEEQVVNLTIPQEAQVIDYNLEYNIDWLVYNRNTMNDNFFVKSLEPRTLNW